MRPQTKQARFEQIENLLKQWQPDLLVVGLPLTLDGEEQYASNHARRFAHQLNGRFGLPVELVDERESSVQAQQRMSKNEDEDAMAAAIILERYFDSLS